MTKTPSENMRIRMAVQSFTYHTSDQILTTSDISYYIITKNVFIAHLISINTYGLKYREIVLMFVKYLVKRQVTFVKISLFWIVFILL